MLVRVSWYFNVLQSSVGGLQMYTSLISNQQSGISLIGMQTPDRQRDYASHAGKLRGQSN